MKCKYFFALVNCIFWIVECETKYLISANDSVHVQNCDLEGVKNISQLNASPEEIIIRSCHIDELSNAHFLRFRRLRTLEITESQLRTISDYAFNGLSTLQILNLSRNNITTVKTWSNENLKALHSLDLRRNAISTLHKSAFERYPNLLKLNLAVNHLSEIPDEIFRSVSVLKHINLGKNYLKSIDSHTFKYLHKLIHLELKHNEIEFIEANSFIGLTHLKILHLQDNRIRSFDQELFSNMPRLHHLNLSHNLLEDFMNGTFVKNEELVLLDISYNNFVAFTEFTFNGLEVLEVFNASHNAIKAVDKESLKELACLRTLDLSNNQLTFLPDHLFNYTSLIETIRLNNNALEAFDGTIFSEMSLKILDLSCNLLSKDNFLWSPLSIEYLNLTFNRYKEINSSALENIMTDLSGNPFACEWLFREGLFLKNVRLGENYVVDSKRNTFKAEGIQCFDENGTTERRLIIVEPMIEQNNEKLEGFPESLQDSKSISTAQPSLDAFDYRSILLWFSFGCLGVLVALRLLKCFMRKSETQMETYRQYRLQPQSIHEELKIYDLK